eukprot:CAMPEP_0185749392 /NCGR_PEP_ID=MMETSP1174-20130828/8088_1 /TAXON_ID=35687 /ORGANISM="Dictyocha speculum, Strain CCMP1381" /LENGTH=132 /DNA_ID=CAMNT_0028425475 /DNA_START=364 /DNA_END=763 /DNA_ORIENTATION=+
MSLVILGSSAPPRPQLWQQPLGDGTPILERYCREARRRKHEKSDDAERLRQWEGCREWWRGACADFAEHGAAPQSGCTQLDRVPLRSEQVNCGEATTRGRLSGERQSYGNGGKKADIPPLTEAAVAPGEGRV